MGNAPRKLRDKANVLLTSGASRDLYALLEYFKTNTVVDVAKVEYVPNSFDAVSKETVVEGTAVTMSKLDLLSILFNSHFLPLPSSQCSY
jgi:hypothetical protein